MKTSQAKSPARSARPKTAPVSKDDWLLAGARPTRLLTPAEEHDLVVEADRWRREVRQLVEPLLPPFDGDGHEHFDLLLIRYRRLSRPRRATARRIDDLLAKYRRVKHVLVLANLAWVTKLARAGRPFNVSDDDMFQEGVCGLLKAIDRFEPQRGHRLMTYATWYIRESMQQARAKQSHLVSLSTHDQTLLGKLEELRIEFLHQRRRQPTEQELARSVEKSSQTLNRLQSATSPTVSLERSGVEGGFQIATPGDASEIDHREEMQVVVNRLLASLPRRERDVVTRRFGLDGREPASLEDIGGDLHVTKERIRQLQRQAIRRMQRQAREESLDLAPM